MCSVTMSFMNHMKNVNSLSDISCRGCSHLLYPWLVSTGWLLTLNLNHTIFLFMKFSRWCTHVRLKLELAYIFTSTSTMYRVKLPVIKYVLIIEHFQIISSSLNQIEQFLCHWTCKLQATTVLWLHLYFEW